VQSGGRSGKREMESGMLSWRGGLLPSHQANYCPYWSGQKAMTGRGWVMGEPRIAVIGRRYNK
jgi:hypothetical protein